MTERESHGRIKIRAVDAGCVFSCQTKIECLLPQVSTHLTVLCISNFCMKLNVREQQDQRDLFVIRESELD